MIPYSENNFSSRVPKRLNFFFVFIFYSPFSLFFSRYFLLANCRVVSVEVSLSLRGDFFLKIYS